MRISEAIKQQKFKSSQDMALINLLYTSNWLKDHQRTFFDNYDLKAQHYNVLRILKGKYPDVSSPGEIKEVMLDKAPDLTRLIDKLIKMNLVDRKVCENNRRKVDVIITKEGIDYLNTITGEMEKIEAGMKNKLTDQEAVKLSDLLDKLRS
jgi:DNA-binding MarR family transcriptional regulator